MKPRASPTTTELTASQTQLEGSAAVGCPHQDNFRGISPSEKRTFFRKIVFDTTSHKNVLETYFEISVKNGL